MLRPKFACLPLSSDEQPPQYDPVPATTGGRSLFGSPIPIVATASGVRRGQWVRFQVIAGRSYRREDGRTIDLLRLRLVSWFSSSLAKPQTPIEWEFRGAKLPKWPVGSGWWGFYVHDGRGTWPELPKKRKWIENKLFLPDLFFPTNSPDNKRFFSLVGRASGLARR